MAMDNILDREELLAIMIQNSFNPYAVFDPFASQLVLLFNNHKNKT